MWSSERFCFTIVSNLLPVFALLLNVNRATASLPPNYDTSVALDDWFNQVTNPTVYKKWIRPNNEFGGPLRVNISLHFYTVAILDEVTAVRINSSEVRLAKTNPRNRSFSLSPLFKGVLGSVVVAPQMDWPTIEDRQTGRSTDGGQRFLPQSHLAAIAACAEQSRDQFHHRFEAHAVSHQNERRSVDQQTVTVFVLSFLKQANVSIVFSTASRPCNRIKLRVFCTMNLHNYPLDRQSCDFAFESSSLPSHDLEVHWCDTDPIHLTKNFQLIGFDLRNISLLEGVSQFKQTGNFSKVIVRFEVARRFGQFLLDVYIPTILFVITSWISFWIEIPAAPARVTLGKTRIDFEHWSVHALTLIIFHVAN